MRKLMLTMWAIIKETGKSKSEALKEAWEIANYNRKLHATRTRTRVTTREYTTNTNEFLGKGATKQVFRTTALEEKEFVAFWVPKSIQKYDKKSGAITVPAWFVAKLEKEHNVTIINA